MHRPHDQWFKALMRVYWERVAAVELERAVHVPPQRIDLAYEPRTRVPELGIVDRIAAHGPGILEYFATDPTDADIKSCIRKRLNYDHERTLEARRRRQAAPPEPRLWLLTTTTPRAAMRTIALVPMAGWPMGVWHVPADQQVHLVVLDELPRDPDTLPLRLLGRGTTLQHALADLRALQPGHVLYTVAQPVLVAYRPAVMQHLENTGNMDTLQEVRVIYEEWMQRHQADGARKLLTHILAQQFGEVPPDAAARIQQASADTLTLWAGRLATAESIDDVFHEERRGVDTLQQVQRIYEEWVQRAEAQGAHDGLARLLMRLLAQRFGAVPPDAAARIQQASADTLTLWIERLLSAQSIDDVFA